MKYLLLLSVILIGCEQPEMPKPITAKKYIPINTFYTTTNPPTGVNIGAPYYIPVLGK